MLEKLRLLLARKEKMQSTINSLTNKNEELTAKNKEMLEQIKDLHELCTRAEHDASMHRQDYNFFKKNYEIERAANKLHCIELAVKSNAYASNPDKLLKLADKMHENIYSKKM